MDSHYEQTLKNYVDGKVPEPLDQARSVVDQVIEKSGESTDNEEKIFAEFASGILHAITDGTNIIEDEGILGLSSDRIKPAYRRLVSWALLRYLGFNGCFPAEPPTLRPKLIAFIKRELGKELSKLHDIDFSLQSHDIESNLSSIVPSIENSFSKSTKFHRLEMFNDFAKQVLKSLNSKQNAGLLFTFMDRRTINAAMKNSLSAIEAFYEAKGVQALTQYYIAIEACESCLQELANVPTKYSRYLEALIRSAKKAVNKQMKDMKLTDPARLEVYLEPKKYPLHLIGTKIMVRIRVTNTGTGNAFNCHLSANGMGLALRCSENLSVGNLQSNESRVIYVKANINKLGAASLSVTVIWSNFDRSDGAATAELKVQGQDPNIDWEALELRQPYALEVATGEEFVGREQLLKRLGSTFSRKNPGSVYLWGQKRVGKTSVAKALAARLAKNDPPICIAYIETIRDITAEDTINSMCTRLIGQMRVTPELAALPVREPTGTLTPLCEFIEKAITTGTAIRFILILDEFDELPVELYKARGVADSFFQTLGKGIAGKQNVGVLLVGGERIPVITRDQGMRLNMYRPERIDYFNRDEEWDAFEELVRRPGMPLEYTDEAIELLWDYSAGNPYFLKEIASRLAQMMIERRDAHITTEEVYEGLRRTLDEVEANSFAHYWDDGLIALDDKDFLDSRSERVRFLLAVADTLRLDNDYIVKEKLIEKALGYRCTTQDTERQLRIFQDRGIIVDNNGKYKFRVKLFQEWLKERGYLDLTAMVAPELHLAEKLDYERLESVTSTEVRELLERWGPYQGRCLTESDVRDWLKQFGSSSDQRLMLKLLQHLKFFSQDIIRARFSQVHRSVVRNIVTRIEDGRRSRRDILISYLGKPGSSGPSMARLYRQENNIHSNNCVSSDSIAERIRQDGRIAALVFVDDFIGTGRTATELLKKLKLNSPYLPNAINDCGMKLWYVSVAGTESGIKKVEEELTNNFSLSSRVICAEELRDQEQAFSKKSPIWSSDAERETAEQIALSFGDRLEPRAPLGFGNTQALIVFEENCPNNSLPILYKTSKGIESFRPLFPRS